MKLTELTNCELASLMALTEKCMEHVARHIRITEHKEVSKCNSLSGKYNEITVKYNMILDEINNRINSIER